MRKVALVAAVLLLTSTAHAKTVSNVFATVPGDKNPNIKVLPLDDPANPYKEQYSALDRWAYAHMALYITDQNYAQFELSSPNIEADLPGRKVQTLRSYVELTPSNKTNGYMIPTLVYLQRNTGQGEETLGEYLERMSHDQPEPSGPYFWSFGIQDEAAEQEYREGIAKLLSSSYPKIPDWMISAASRDSTAYLLPDGGVVFSTPIGDEKTQLRTARIDRYDSTGQLVKSATTNESLRWQREVLYDPPEGIGRKSPYFRMIEHRDKSGNVVGRSNNMAGISERYEVYRGEDGKLLAVTDFWQGKTLTGGDLGALPIMPYPYFSPVDYSELVRVHDAQAAGTKP